MSGGVGEQAAVGPAIEALAIINRFGSQTVHDGLDMSVVPGEVFGIVGGSGSGKSVLLRTILGLHRPQGGEVRGNLAAGGKGVAQPISARDREIAEALGPILFARGLMLVGLDIIGESLTEINVTSPTCFQEITDQMGCDVAALFMDAVDAAL